MKILIISGGISSERKISFFSAREVKKALVQNGCFVEIFDLKEGYLKLRKVVKEFDVLFPVLHGEEGEGGKLHKFLATLDKPFIGGDWKGFKKGWYKLSFKKFCDENKVPTAPWKQIKSKKDILKFGFPCVLKASSGGSSKEVAILRDQSDLKKASVKKILKLNDWLLVEKYLPGIEVTVGILKDKPLPVIEVIPPKGGWFDYENKYSGATRELPNAPSLTERQREEVQTIALKIHKLLNLRHYCRIDFIVERQEDSEGRFIVAEGMPYALEVNTIPGLTSESLFPKAAQALDISFPALTYRLVQMAIQSKS